jgi:hypothetical protein
MLDDPTSSDVIKEAGSFNAHIKGNLEDDNNNNPMIFLNPSTTTSCLPCISSLPSFKPSGKPYSKLKFNYLNMNGFTSFKAMSSPRSMTYFISFKIIANFPLSICEQMENKDINT